MWLPDHFILFWKDWTFTVASCVWTRVQTGQLIVCAEHLIQAHFCYSWCETIGFSFILQNFILLGSVKCLFESQLSWFIVLACINPLTINYCDKTSHYFPWQLLNQFMILKFICRNVNHTGFIKKRKNRYGPFIIHQNSLTWRVTAGEGYVKKQNEKSVWNIVLPFLL